VLELPEPYNQTEVISIHSISKGLLGECGLRGGYLEMLNIDSQVKQQIRKIRTVSLCANTVGQIAIDLMCNPPNSQSVSKEIVAKYE